MRNTAKQTNPNQLINHIKSVKPSVVPIAFAQPTLQPGEVNLNIVGSGFVVSKEGYICTCAHVISGKQGQLQVGVKENGNYVWAPAQPSVVDNERDIAIIKLPPPKDKKIEFLPLKLSDSSKVVEGQEIAFTGFPFGGMTGGGFAPSTTKGIISAFRPKNIGGVDINHFQLDAVTMEGNSGAPVFDAETGEVVGIVNARFDPLMLGNIPQVIIGGRPLGISTNIGFAIPINLVKQVIQVVLEKRS